MANPKWRINFKSFQGADCRVDIYDTTTSYTGSPTILTGATDPITIQEDTDDSLLNVVRTKTGYLNIMETAATKSAIESMKPTTNVSRYVKCYRESEPVFMGFMQAQTFENDWLPSPRRMSFPIFSPLALLENMTMPVYNPPTSVMLCALLADIVDALNDAGAEYTQVVWPQMSVLLNNTVSSLISSPFNSEHDATVISPALFVGKECSYVLEGICNAFGWMVHDAPGVLVFSKFDHTGDYLTCSVSNLRTYSGVSAISQTGATAASLTTYYTPSDSDGKESIIMPAQMVQLNYDGGYVKAASFDFNHLTYHSTTNYGNQYVAWMQSNTPELTGDKLMIMNYIVNGKISLAGANACSCGSSTNVTTCILVNMPSTTSAISGEIFRVKFYNRPTGSAFKVKYSATWGDMVTNLGNEINVKHKEVGVIVKIGNQYYLGGGSWGTTKPSIYTYGLNGEYYWEISNAPAGMPVELEFQENYSLTIEDYASRVPLFAISSISLEEGEETFADLLVYQGETDQITIHDGYGQDVEDIYMAFNCYRLGSNNIGTGIISDRSGWFTTYTYMLYSRERLTILCRRASLPYFWLYCVYISFLSFNWRLISVEQNPWNDETRVILQRSLA